MSIQNRLDAIRQLRPAPQAERETLKLERLKTGGFIRIQDDIYQVKSMGYYLDVKWKDFSHRKSDYWITELELFSLQTGKVSFLEWEVDDELEVSVTESLLKLREITYEGARLSHSDLEEIADEENGEVIYQGKRFHYVEDDTWAGRYAKEKVKDGIPMRAYEFESDQGEYLTIETWHEDDDERPDRDAFLSRPVTTSDIEILQLSAIQ